MDQNRFLEIQTSIILIAHFVDNVDGLVEFIGACEKADTLGPLIDPTLWMEKNKELEIIKNTAASLLQFQNHIKINLLPHLKKELSKNEDGEEVSENDSSNE